MLIDRLRRLASSRAGDVAVVAGDGALTYGGLWAKSSDIAARLKRDGIGRGNLVAIYLTRSTNAIAALVGIMRAGAAYTVVEDEGNRAEHVHRLRQMSASLVIAAADLSADLRAKGLPAIPIDDAPPFSTIEAAPERTSQEGCVPPCTAYVLFTSGSTGTPKGVMISHGNIDHYTTSLLDMLTIQEPLRYAHVSTLAADLGNTCLFLSLYTGGQLHLIDGVLRRDPLQMSRYIAQQRIDVLKITPSHWKALLPAAAEAAVSLRFLILGGEVVGRDLAKATWLSGVTRTLVNHYGPTETTIGVLANVVRSLERIESFPGPAIPIGRAIGRTRLLVRTAEGVFRDTAAAGELFVGGPSVGLGYRNNAEANATAFVEQIEGAAKFYRTGDLVEVDADGIVTFRGRADNQVKVNGYRIELEHVEAVVAALPEVRDAAVLVMPVAGHDQIVAAVRFTAPSTNPAEARGALARVLPAHMVPARWLAFDDLPRNANGKTDRKVLRSLVAARLESQAERRSPSSDDGTAAAAGVVEAAIRKAWSRHLGRNSLGLDDDFFALGGDSLGAIQVISDLQLEGLPITAAMFFRSPTIRHTMMSLRGRASTEPRVWPLRSGGAAFSSAQEAFFGAEMVEPDHWNQSLLLRTDRPIDEGLLAAALRTVTEAHPMLRTAFERLDSTERTWRAHLPSPAEAAPQLSVSRLVSPGEERQIWETSAALQRAVDLATGNLLRAHLFASDAAGSLLFLTCHHLAVDAVSWRVLLDDIDRAYAALFRGEPPRLGSPFCTFWDWVDHVAAERARLAPDMLFWASVDKPTYAPAANLEGDARTIWLGFSQSETTALGTACGTRLRSTLIAAFAQAHLSRSTSEAVEVDVEAHGRLSLDESLDPSRLVGWFTSSFPISIREDPAASSARNVEAVLANVPNQGIAYAMNSGFRPGKTSRLICYNYLGDYGFGHGTLGLRPARHRVAPARGPANDRLYRYKLTARVIEGRLVVDFGYSSILTPDQAARDLMEETRRILRRWTGREAGDGGPTVPLLIEHGSSAGLLTYVPSELALPATDGRGVRRGEVLLTGATGFLGCHALRELILQTQATIVCIVRAKDDATAHGRLNAVYDGYFGDGSLVAHRGRCVALAGDVAEDAFGLGQARHDDLAGRVDAIYHFAADTRLSGSMADFDRRNVGPLASMIAFAEAGRAKHLHHMSTLAVAGIAPTSGSVIFDEHSLDIGQTFQNGYEASKFKGEELVRAFIRRGGRATIYRSGNVSGDSRSGLFQANAGDNRTVQILGAVVRVGAAPANQAGGIALSPVDVVTRGIVALSLDPNSSGQTFHVDQPEEVPYRTIFEVLRQIGHEIETSDAPDLVTLFERSMARLGPRGPLALFWARRPDRRVRFDHRGTLERLRQLGIEFAPTSRDWLARFLRGLPLETDSSRAPHDQTSGCIDMPIPDNRNERGIGAERDRGASAAAGSVPS